MVAHFNLNRDTEIAMSRDLEIVSSELRSPPLPGSDTASQNQHVRPIMVEHIKHLFSGAHTPFDRSFVESRAIEPTPREKHAKTQRDLEIERVKRSTVQVDATSKKDGSLGSGFIATDDGKVVTDFHVIDKQKHFEVIKDGHRYNAKVIATDRKHDLAVLQITDPGRITPAKVRTRRRAQSKARRTSSIIRILAWQK